MGRLNIVTWPDPVLARDCDPVGEIDASLRRLAEDMLATLYAAEGRGLAAPQVGQPLRLFVMDTEWKERAPAPRIFINPEITWTSPETQAFEEGCLSIPGILARVERPAQIHMRWTEIDGSAQEADLHGFDAICAQHELDHLDGIVTLDRVDRQMRLALIEEYNA
ncbi:peptide deformylase [Aliiruegeria sabulilitoris]|uniref:peptide deformylase n=1 Tax=Aliiruegeria sabulilitoris TaxID=1510458 RepID=UPI0008348742|nr:peptide deformylase [Aliiruegeria sabulilitoris]NDR56859.1 peptide deformylase [Pseudoruegeria sp. M32A2M]